MIPIAALVGVMFMVVIGTFAWNSILRARTNTVVKSIATKVMELPL